jgi:hypothetical protein
LASDETRLVCSGSRLASDRPRIVGTDFHVVKEMATDVGDGARVRAS